MDFKKDIEMKMDQIAFYARTDVQEYAIKEHFGLTKAEWVKDTVTARSILPDPYVGHPDNVNETVNVANLLFNYDLGIELEILRYVEGSHFHDYNHALGYDKVDPFISHIGIHLADEENFPEVDDCFFNLRQETFTISHTAPYLTDPNSPGFGRKYHYRIYEMAPNHFVKYIKRVHPK